MHFPKRSDMTTQFYLQTRHTVRAFRGATTFLTLGGPIPWSRLLYRTKCGWYTQFCGLQSVT